MAQAFARTANRLQKQRRRFAFREPCQSFAYVWIGAAVFRRSNLHHLTEGAEHIAGRFSNSEHHVDTLQGRYCNVFRMNRDQDRVLKDLAQACFDRGPGRWQKMMGFIDDEPVRPRRAIPQVLEVRQQTGQKSGAIVQGDRAWQITERFAFQNLPVSTRQGELFG